VIVVSAQDVQISGSMTGGHVGAGLDNRGVFFSWVLHFLDKQRKVLYMDVLMLRSHGCERAATRHQDENNNKEPLDTGSRPA